MTWLLLRLHAVANGRATSRLLKTLVKLSTVARMHGFPRVIPANYNLTAARKLKLAASTLRNRCIRATVDDSR